MKNFSKIAISTLASTMLVACSSTGSTNTQTQSTTSDTMLKIGIVQFVQHDALDKATKGFKDGLKEAGYEEGKNITFDEQNAQGDLSNCETIASKLINDKVNLIFANATPAAQAVAAKTTDIPILITSVTDPKSAGLVESNEMPNTNVTGTSDLTPIKDQVAMIKDILPNAKKVGLLYNNSEDNSLFQAEIAKEAFKEYGLEYTEFTVSDTTQVQSVTESMIGKVDVVYTATDNLIAENITTATQVLNENKVPLIVGEASQVEKGALITKGIDYYTLGKKTAEQAVKVLQGADPKTLPIAYVPAETITVNQTTAELLGITLPESILSKAVIVK